MKLDRNIEGNEGRGKYAILNLRTLATYERQGVFAVLPPDLSHALEVLEKARILEWGEVGSSNEFFLLKLKDESAARALAAYADGYENIDPEWAAEVRELASRSGPRHPLCKRAD